jgi:AcrR family transcriptional regulator
VRKRDTRRELILAAERLFAERGIEGVSLREINLAAKQRNTSAAHYHFGSKDALVDAIFEFRRAEIGKRRDELLDAFESGERKTEPRSLAEALILPLAKEVQQGPESGRYLEFLAHLFLTSPSQVGNILRKHEAAETRWIEFAQRAMPHMPRRVLFTRLFLMGRHVVISLAVYQRRGLGVDDVGFEAYLSDMIDAVAGYISAAPSERTLALARQQRQDRESETTPGSLLPRSQPPQGGPAGQTEAEPALAGVASKGS